MPDEPNESDLVSQPALISAERWSPFTAEVLADPASSHQALLAQCPVHHCQDFDPPFFTLSRYADVEQALRDIDTFSSQFGQGPRFTDPQGMLCDPPQHTAMRQLVQPAFTPRQMAALRPRVTKLCTELLDGLPPVFDVHDDFAFPLPVLIIADLLGIPTDDLEQFKYWSDVQVAAMGSPDPSIYADDQAAFFSYMRHALRSRRDAISNQHSVPDDLLSLIAGAKDAEGEFISEADAQSMLQQLLVGGNETTTSLITNMVWRLLQEPELYAEVAADPQLISAVVEESLRFDPPVLGLYRNTTQDIEIHGVHIPAGSKVYMNYAAANRDPEVFANPDQFDPKRAAKRHLGFGLGVHFCLGAPMARLEAEIALAQLVQKLPELKLLGSGERITPFFLWGRRKLPVSCT